MSAEITQQSNTKIEYQSTSQVGWCFSVRRYFYRCNYWSRAKEDSSGYTHKQERSEKSIDRYSCHFACDFNACHCNHLILFGWYQC